MADRFWASYGTLVLAIFSGYGYVVGVAAVSLFARTLGVSVQDLSISTRDYLVLAAVYGGVVFLAMLLSVISVSVFASVVARSQQGLSSQGSENGASDPLLLATGIAAVLSPMILVYFVYLMLVRGTGIEDSWDELLQVRWWVLTPVFVSLFALAALLWSILSALGRSDPEFDRWWAFGRRRIVPPTRVARSASVVVVLAGFVLTATMATSAADDWAKDLRSSSTADGPWAMALLVQPSFGHLENDPKCILRIAPGVLVIDDETVVGEETVFAADGCEIARGP